MNTKDIATAFRMRHWAGIMDERKRSGLSVRRFCINAGIPENNYYYWQKKLREAACEEIANAESATGLEPVRFIEAQLPVQPARSTAANYPRNQVCIEATGVRIIACGEYPADKLAVLLREVARP